MPLTHRLLPPLALLTLSACGGVTPRLPLAEVFPDLGVLVTTQEPEKVRDQLRAVELPTTSDHREHLLTLLRAQPTISAAHLALLVRAVDLQTVFTVSDGTSIWTYPYRGKADNSAFVDQLLTEGAAKLGDVDRRWLGELIGMTQSDATLQLLARRWATPLDDGSDRALDELLAGMPGSPALMPFVTTCLLPQGKLDGDKGWRLFGALSFDQDRVALLRELVARGHAFDSDRFVDVMKAMSFDNARTQAFAIMAPKIPGLTPETARRAMTAFTFDSGRTDAFAVLGKCEGLTLDETHLVPLVKLCSFDNGRIGCIERLSPALRGAVDAKAAKQVLAAFSFDSDRLKAVKVLAPRLLQLDVETRKALAATFSFDSNRTEALAAMMK